MKIFNYLLFLTLGFFSFQTVSAQEWHKYDPMAGFDVNCVDILKPGWLVFGGGQHVGTPFQIMFQSTNYGINWNENPHDGIANCNNSIAFADTLNGFGVGYGGLIIKTSDGGLNWGFPATPTTRDLTKVVNVSLFSYCAVGGSVSGDSTQTILLTTNSGTTWTTVYDTAGPCLKSLFFINTQKGYAVGDSGVILATLNGGHTWSAVPSPLQRNFNTIYFINADTGFIAGGTPEGGRTILQTQNGGTTWTVLTDTTGGMLYDISFVDQAVGYAVGDSATVLKTMDGGNTWAAQNISSLLTGAEAFRAVKFYDNNSGLIAGLAGELYVYTGWPVGLFTLGAVIQDSVQATLYGSVNTSGYTSSIGYIYSQDSTFATYSSSSFSAISTSSYTPNSEVIYGLTPNTWYYYFVTDQAVTGDTLRFFTGPYSGFNTVPGTAVDSTTLLLRGDVHGVTPVSNLMFEYGTTPFLGSVINATPGNVSDTTDHPDSALLGSILPYTFYYYRLRGIQGADTIRGDIYLLGNPYRLLQTLPPIYQGDTTVIMYGEEQSYPGTVTLGFQYGPSSTGMQFQTFPNVYAASDSLRVIDWYTSGLPPHQIYNYRLQAITNSGTSYGRVYSFSTGQPDSIIVTLPAQLVTSTTAMLEGSVDSFPGPATLSFVYGTDSGFTSELAATPGVVNDSLYHQVTALLTGVPTNKLFYYYLKAVTANGELDGAIRSVYIGDNEIPNWDFQAWTDNTYAMPTGWNILNKNFGRVPGHSGNYALYLSGYNFAIIGFPTNGSGAGFGNGIPFTETPDSISFYAKGNFLPGDSPGVLVYLYRAGTVVAQNYNYVSVNDSVFTRFCVPIRYQSLLTPDSLVLGLTATRIPDSILTIGYQNNYVIFDDVAFVPNNEPVYNGDFETWFDYRCKLPDSWYSPTFYGIDSNNASTIVPIVTQVTDDSPLDYAAEIKNTSFPGLGLEPGDMGFHSTIFDNTSPQFSVHAKHQYLNGVYEAFPVNGDTIVIEIFMFYQGQRVGYGALIQYDSVTQFTPFQIPINYLAANSFQISDLSPTPDSADIEIHAHTLSSYVPKGPSKVMVDKLRFDGFGADTITNVGITPVAFDKNGIKVYPNPAKNTVMVETEQAAGSNAYIQLFDLDGRLAKEVKVATGDARTKIDLAELNSGFYILRFTGEQQAYNVKIVVVK